MNPFYNGLMNGFQQPPHNQVSTQLPVPPAPVMNPIQQANAIMQAMRDPVGFVRQMIPDLPKEISNDPNKILQYMHDHMGFTNEQIQQVAYSIPRF